MDITWNSLFVGQTLLEYDRLDSTNSEAERLLAIKKLPEGAVLLAREQYGGRGQRGNTWHSGAGLNLTASFVLYPKLPSPAHQFPLNQMASLAILDVLLELGLEGACVKWPNDVLVNGRKIAGILIQNALSGKGISRSVVGIGLNVNQRHFPKGAGKPTSLLLETGREHPIQQVLSVLCPALERRYLQIQNRRLPALAEAYHQHLYQRGRMANYRRATGGEFEGEILGVSDEGLLRVRTNGVVEEFPFKEIVFL